MKDEQEILLIYNVSGLKDLRDSTGMSNEKLEETYPAFKKLREEELKRFKQKVLTEESFPFCPNSVSFDSLLHWRKKKQEASPLVQAMATGERISFVAGIGNERYYRDTSTSADTYQNKKLIRETPFDSCYRGLVENQLIALGYEKSGGDLVFNLDKFLSSCSV